MAFSTSTFTPKTGRVAASRNLVVARSGKQDARSHMMALVAAAPLILAPIAMADIASIESDVAVPNIQYGKELLKNEDKGAQGVIAEPDVNGAVDSVFEKAKEGLPDASSAETRSFVESAKNFFSGDLSELPDGLLSAPVLGDVAVDVEKIAKEEVAPRFKAEGDKAEKTVEGLKTDFVDKAYKADAKAKQAVSGDLSEAPKDVEKIAEDKVAPRFKAEGEKVVSKVEGLKTDFVDKAYQADAKAKQTVGDLSELPASQKSSGDQSNASKGKVTGFTAGGVPIVQKDDKGNVEVKK